MIARLTTLALAATVLAVSAVGDAEAGERKKRKWRQIYDQAPEYVLRRPLSYIFGGGYSLTPEEFAMLYGDDPDFDEDYYDPERDVQTPAAKKKSKPASAVVKPKAKPAVKTAAKPAESTVSDPAAKSDAAAMASMPSARGVAASWGCHTAIDQSGLATRSTIWCTTESPVHARCSRVGQST
jgi:hypothetical protein